MLMAATRRLFPFMGAFVCWAAAERPLHAQPLIEPPVLQDFVRASPPQERPAAVAVTLSLTIDARGQVMDAMVLAVDELEEALANRASPAEPMNEDETDAFAAAAREAALGFRFSPAMRGRSPVAVRIRFRYVFEANEASSSAPHRLSEEHETRPDASWGETPSEERGIAGTSPVETPHASGPAPAEDEEAFGASARVRGNEGELVRHVMDADQLATVPGTRGDPLRAIGLLPGLGRPAYDNGSLLIRGAAPTDSAAFIDGMSVPLVFHFGGLTSVVPVELVHDIELSPSNFAVRYGRRSGGVVDVRLREPATGNPGAAGSVELDVIDATATLRLPLGKRGASLIGLRRSLLDLTLAPVVQEFGRH